MRQEAHHARVFVALPELFDGLQRLTSRVQVDDHQVRRVFHQAHQGLFVRCHLHLNAELFGRFCELHLKKQIIHKGHDSSHQVSSQNCHQTLCATSSFEQQLRVD